jgi:hypothetical protein
MRRLICAFVALTVLAVAAPTADAQRLSKDNARKAVRKEVRQRFDVLGTVRILCADRRGNRIRCKVRFVRADGSGCADKRVVVERRRAGTLRVRGLKPKCVAPQSGETPPPPPAPATPPTAPPTEPPGPAAPPGTEPPPPGSDRSIVARPAQLSLGCYPRDPSGVLTYTLDPWYQTYYVYFCLFDYIWWYEYDYYVWTVGGYWALWAYYGYVPATGLWYYLGP